MTMKNCIFVLLVAFLNTSLADQTPHVKHTVKISYTNGSTTSGHENLSEAEARLLEKAKKICSQDEDIQVASLEFKIKPAVENIGCASFDQDVEPLTDKPLTWFRCYPPVEASAEIWCAPKGTGPIRE